MVELAKFAEVPVLYGIPWANGIMERIWHLAATYAPAGDIGKMPNDAIARECAWPEADADKLVFALVKSRWLDEHPVHRLIVHDWSEHCEDNVHSKLARMHVFFADGKTPKITGLRKDEAETAKTFYSRNPFATRLQPRLGSFATPLATNSPALPCQAKPDQDAPVAVASKVIEFPEKANPEEQIDRLYGRHPLAKRRDRVLAEQAFMEAVIEGKADPDEIDRVHAAMCETEAWKWNDGAGKGVQTLAEWLNDKGWKYPPRGRDSPKQQGEAYLPYVDPFKHLIAKTQPNAEN